MNGVPAMLMGVSTGVVINLGDKGSASVSSDPESLISRFLGGAKVAVAMAISVTGLISYASQGNLHTVRRTSSWGL